MALVVSEVSMYTICIYGMIRGEMIVDVGVGVGVVGDCIFCLYFQRRNDVISLQPWFQDSSQLEKKWMRWMHEMHIYI